MKTQKVEIEIPIFDGYEFVEYGIVKKKHDLDNYYIYFPTLEGLLCSANSFHIGEFHLIYKKKKPRRIIYEEVREDHLKRGDFYRDDDGDVNMWISDMQSREKHPILKKVHDDFEVNNE